MAVPISSSAPDATTGYSYKDPVLSIGFVVLCVKVVMYSSQGHVINETPRTFIIQCTVQQTIHLNVAINTTFKKVCVKHTSMQLSDGCITLTTLGVG